MIPHGIITLFRRDSRIGMPISAVTRRAVSSALASMAAASRSMAAARSAGLNCGHGPASKAFLAAFTATSTSVPTIEGTAPGHLLGGRVHDRDHVGRTGSDQAAARVDVPVLEQRESLPEKPRSTVKVPVNLYG